LSGDSKRKERQKYATEKTRWRFAGETLLYIIVIGLLGFALLSIFVQAADALVAENVISADWPLIVVAVLLLIPMIATVWVASYVVSAFGIVALLRYRMKRDLGKVERSAIAHAQGADRALQLISSLDGFNSALLKYVSRYHSNPRYGNFQQSELLRKIDLAFACIFLALSERSWTELGNKPFAKFRKATPPGANVTNECAIDYADIPAWAGQLDDILFGRPKKREFGTTVTTLGYFFEETVRSLEDCIGKPKVDNLRTSVDEYWDARTQSWLSRRAFWADTAKQLAVSGLALVVGYLLGTLW
jgi:hypothetical protein